MNIHENIKKLREERGWTQEDLAKITGLGEKYISALERKTRNPGKKAIEKLLDAFLVDEMTLRFGAKKENQNADNDDRARAKKELDQLSLSELLQVRSLMAQMIESHQSKA